MQQALFHSPEDAYYTVRLGMALLQGGYPAEAAAALQRAVDLDPRNASYHALLADTYFQLGFEREALLQYRQAGQLDTYDNDFVERVRRLTATDALY